MRIKQSVLHNSEYNCKSVDTVINVLCVSKGQQRRNASNTGELFWVLHSDNNG